MVVVSKVREESLSHFLDRPQMFGLRARLRCTLNCSQFHGHCVRGVEGYDNDIGDVMLLHIMELDRLFYVMWSVKM